MTDSLPSTHEFITTAPMPAQTDAAAEHLGPADIHEFQRLVSDACGSWLDDGDAWTRANQLVGLLRMLMTPLAEDPESAAIQARSSVVSLDEIPKDALG